MSGLILRSLTVDKITKVTRQKQFTFSITFLDKINKFYLKGVYLQLTKCRPTRPLPVKRRHNLKVYNINTSFTQVVQSSLIFK